MNRESSVSAGEDLSHRQTRFLLIAGFGGLLILMGLLGLSAISFLYRTELREGAIRRGFMERDRALENLRGNIYVSGTNMRDFLLDEDDGGAAAHRLQFLRRRADIESAAKDYERLLPPNTGVLRETQDELASYFATVTPALAWNARDRHARGYRFMQQQVLPRRIAMLAQVDRVQKVSEKQLEADSDGVAAMLSSFRAQLLSLLVLTVAIGIAWAATALWRLARLERESLERFREVLHARGELTRLSGEVVSAQEDERRRISRELHDEVGQVLSAIVLGLGNLRGAIRGNRGDEALHQLQLVQDMTERNVSVVRNMSLLLRPTMLDDLGLVPALRWLAREVTRNSSMAVEVCEGAFVDRLPEEHRTCIFRVVQEAVRNASRHSGATQAQICLREERDAIRISVRDDGKGFVVARDPGMGILGMQERVARLGGEFSVDSEPGRGALVSFSLPAAHEIIPLRTA